MRSLPSYRGPATAFWNLSVSWREADSTIALRLMFTAALGGGGGEYS